MAGPMVISANHTCADITTPGYQRTGVITVDGSVETRTPLFSEASLPPVEALSHSSRIRWDQRHVWMSKYYDIQEKPAGEWKKMAGKHE